MYEKPKLVQVGDVEEVVLGVVPVGDDMDGNRLISDFEFAGDQD